MRRILFLLVLAASTIALPSSDLDSMGNKHVVVISDVHGDDKAFLKSLWIAYSNLNLQTIGFAAFEGHFGDKSPETPLESRNDVILVQMGDLIDRGPFGGRCIEIAGMISRVLGWETRILYGNHDLFAVLGYGYQTLIHKNEDIDREEGGIRRDSALWEGMVSNQLIALRIRAASGSSLFVHAGANMQWLSNFMPSFAGDAPLDMDALNKMVERSIRTGEDIATPFSNEASVVVTRQLLSNDRDTVCAELEKVLARFGVDRLFVGHSPMETRRVMSRCEGRVILTDVGMSRWMSHEMHNQDDPQVGGQPSAILMRYNSTGHLENTQAFYTASVKDDDNVFEESIMDIDEWAAAQTENKRKITQQAAEKVHKTAQTGHKRKVNEENGDPNVKKRSKMVTNPQAKISPNHIYEDEYMFLNRGEYGEFRGFWSKFARERRELVIGALRTIKSTVSPKAFGIPKIYIFSSSMIFIVTSSAEVLLSDAIIDSNLALQVEGIVEAVHKTDICLGLNVENRLTNESKADEVVSFFSLDQISGRVLLVNFSRIHSCDTEEKAREIDFIHEAFPAAFEDSEDDEEEEDASEAEDILPSRPGQY